MRQGMRQNSNWDTAHFLRELTVLRRPSYVISSEFLGASMSKRTIAMVMASGLLMHSVTCYALDKDAFRTQARALAAELRKTGEPIDRCSLGAFIAEGPVVTRVFTKTPLQPGDRLISVKGQTVEGNGSSQVINILRTIAPTETILVSVKRDNHDVDLQVECSDSRPSNEAILAMLDAAAAGKFDNCVSAYAGRGDLGTVGVSLASECAVNSKQSKEAAPSFTLTALKMMVEDAYWIPSQRPEVIQKLRTLEGTLVQSFGKSKFQELVDMSSRWPGGGNSYESTKPDWALFRRNAENSLRSRLIDPDSARFEWQHGFLYGTWKPVFAKRVEGYWTCGQVNARNRMGGYTGSSSFVVVIDPAGTVKFSEMGEVRDFDFTNMQCANSIGSLPPPPPELLDSGASAANSTSSSLADELKKLADLRNSGAITQAEFESAKSKLLNSSR